MNALPNRNNHERQTMASTDHTQPRAIIRNGNLFTPEEPIWHSFSKTNGEASASSGLPKLAPIQTLSPPVSPEGKTLPSFQYPSTDAPLYPEHSVSEASEPESPLFSSPESQASVPTPPEQRQPPTFEERARRQGISNLGRFVGPDFYLPPTRNAAVEYTQNSMTELEGVFRAIREKAQLPPPSKSTAAPRDPISTSQIASLGRFAASKPAGIVKSKAVSKTTPSPVKPTFPSKAATKPKAARAATPTAKATTPHKRTPRAQTTEEFHDRAFPSHAQQAPKHKRAAPTKKVEGKEDDSTWRELPDYCPPIESLDLAAKPLKVQWKGNPLDISDEPDRELLHPTEYDAASELRLRPQQYLANKRRMFMARVKFLREKKNFTKTAAQNATNIDVNKTSRLWEAYDRVGWFEEKLFMQYADGDDEMAATPEKMEE